MIYLILFLAAITQHLSKWNVNEYGVALAGYDPVSYFEGTPSPGKPELSYQYESAIFYFSSVSSIEKFQKEPERYLPAYGGFCAYAMGSSGEKIDIHPANFEIASGRLFLFSIQNDKNMKDVWRTKREFLIKSANNHWSNLQE